ncbi:MAG: hypothetical protein ACP5KJ_03700 [Candidatus Micrarchaeia archaeon]
MSNIEIQILCLLGIILAVIIAIRSRYTVFKESLLLLVLFGISGIPDTIATVEFAYLNPEIESNPITKLFLGVPYLIAVGVFMWTIGWISLAELLERMGRRALSRIVLVGLFVGHALGFMSWVKYMDDIMIILIFAITLFTLGILYWVYKVSYNEKIKQ